MAPTRRSARLNLGPRRNVTYVGSRSLSNRMVSSARSNRLTVREGEVEVVARAKDEALDVDDWPLVE